MPTIYTVGHSTYQIEILLDLIKNHNITAIADVRSTPYSRMNPQYNRENLQTYLKEYGIKYVFLGDELGARPRDPLCYQNGRVVFAKIKETIRFQQGIERLLEGIKSFKISLFCSEKEPLSCHRTILVSNHLYSMGVKVSHIHEDGHLESHEDAIERLLRIHGLDEENFFMNHDQRIEEAYRRQEQLISHSKTRKD